MFSHRANSIRPFFLKEAYRWKSDPATLTDASKGRDVKLEPVSEVLNKGRRWCSEKVPFIHSYHLGTITKTVGYLPRNGLSACSHVGMNDFSAELDAGGASALLGEPEDLAVLLLRQS